MDKKNKEYYIAIGLSLGVAFGLLLDQLALGISIGLVFGIGAQYIKKNK